MINPHSTSENAQSLKRLQFNALDYYRNGIGITLLNCVYRQSPEKTLQYKIYDKTIGFEN